MHSASALRQRQQDLVSIAGTLAPHTTNCNTRNTYLIATIQRGALKLEDKEVLQQETLDSLPLRTLSCSSLTASHVVCSFADMAVVRLDDAWAIPPYLLHLSLGSDGENLG